MADITYIPIRQLYPHPDNPRKELGDLSELAASSMTVLCSGSISTSWPNQSRKTNCFSVK